MSPALSVRWCQKRLLTVGGLFSSSPAWVGGEWPTQATLNFSGSLFSWEGLEFTFSPSYELMPLPICSTRMFHWYWLCSGCNQLCPPTSQLECCWASQFPGVVAKLSGQLGLTDSIADGAVIQLFFWGGWVGGEGSTPNHSQFPK